MNRIACSPLTGRIHSGRVNKQGTAFVGEKTDVTSDVLRSVIEKADFHGGSFDIEGGEQRWIVTVSKQTAAPTAPTEPVADALNTLCKMLHSGEEVEGDDGLAMLVPIDLWNEAQEAIELLVGEDGATPPSAVEAAQPGAVGEHTPCKGTNCGITRTDQNHSPECYAEHEAACKVDPLDTAGNRHPEYRYAGYKGQPLKPGCTADQAAAYREGVRAAAPTTEATSSSDAERLDAARFRAFTSGAVDIMPAIIQACVDKQSADTDWYRAAIDAAIATKGGKL